MLKSFKYKLEPTKEQAILLLKHIGSVRFVYNLALETKQAAWVSNRVNLDCFSLKKQLPQLKNECQWLNEINSQSLQQAIINLESSFVRFFKGQSGFPKFKKKSDVGSFCIPQRVSIKNNKLIIPKFTNGIKIVLHRQPNGIIKQATITKTPTGKYFVSVLCDTNKWNKKPSPIKEKTTIGIDLGIKTFIVTSDGNEYDNPKFLRRMQGRLKYMQRRYSRCKGKRMKRKLAIMHERVANQRRDFLHKVSAELIRDNQSIAIETLQVSNMLKNHKLAQLISDAGWGMFVHFIKYKAAWNGVNILEIGAFEPSSKMCSACGNINKNLTLQDREWVCLCGAVLNRDINAAINIKKFALKNYVCGMQTKNRNELPTLVGVMTSEARKEQST